MINYIAGVAQSLIPSLQITSQGSVHREKMSCCQAPQAAEVKEWDRIRPTAGLYVLYIVIYHLMFMLTTVRLKHNNMPFIMSCNQIVAGLIVRATWLEKCWSKYKEMYK